MYPITQLANDVKSPYCSFLFAFLAWFIHRAIVCVLARNTFQSTKKVCYLWIFRSCRALNPASSSKSIEDRLAYDSDKDVPDETTSPTVMGKRVSSVGSLGTELDWIEPSLQLCNPRMLRPYGSNGVYDAFHLLQTEPCVQVTYIMDS